MADNRKDDHPSTLYGGPTKRFFVSMLTRDIDLDDAVLDLIDNSVDGAMRLTAKARRATKPYEGYWARLDLTKNGFTIEDNCGGIPDSRIDAAFRLGRPETQLDQDIPTIGMYGIGMKRSLFKIGLEATVESSSPDGIREVTYDKEWLDYTAADADTNWDLDIARRKAKKKHGVTIVIPELRPDVARQFGNAAYLEDLKRKIGKHFGYLILRGFEIKVNGETVKPNTLRLYCARTKKDVLNPFDYIAEMGGVRIRVTVGFFRSVPRPEEIEDEEEASRTRDEAGISVICNDRVILDNDTTFRTGWGTRGVPKFHNQFMAIGGLISFLSNNADALPVSTTKTGIEMESEIYDHALSVCAEAIKVFTSFTNKWKGKIKDTAVYFDNGTRKDALLEIELAKKDGRKVAKLNATRFKPQLPLPSSVKTMQRITFARPIKDIELVSTYLFNEIRPASEVGERCFDNIVALAKGD